MPRGGTHGKVKPNPSRRCDNNKVEPPDIHERISWKRSDLRLFMDREAAYPLDPVWPHVVNRMREELRQLEALRDGTPWRKNG